MGLKNNILFVITCTLLLAAGGGAKADDGATFDVQIDADKRELHYVGTARGDVHMSRSPDGTTVYFSRGTVQADTAPSWETIQHLRDRGIPAPTGRGLIGVVMKHELFLALGNKIAKQAAKIDDVVPKDKANAVLDYLENIALVSLSMNIDAKTLEKNAPRLNKSAGPATNWRIFRRYGIKSVDGSITDQNTVQSIMNVQQSYLCFDKHVIKNINVEMTENLWQTTIDNILLLNSADRPMFASQSITLDLSWNATKDERNFSKLGDVLKRVNGEHITHGPLNVRTGKGKQQLDGTADNDTLIGGTGDDVLNGHSGNDLLIGQVGVDHLNGGDGDDRLIGGKDGDFLDGGSGANTLTFYYGDSNYDHPDRVKQLHPHRRGHSDKHDQMNVGTNVTGGQRLDYAPRGGTGFLHVGKYGLADFGVLGGQLDRKLALLNEYLKNAKDKGKCAFFLNIDNDPSKVGVYVFISDGSPDRNDIVVYVDNLFDIEGHVHFRIDKHHHDVYLERS